MLVDGLLIPLAFHHVLQFDTEVDVHGLDSGVASTVSQ